MTLLLGGSVLLIAGSAVALVLGWLNANEGFIWASIGATAASAAMLIVAFFRSRKEAPAAATAPPTAESVIDPEILKDREERSKQKYQRAMTRGPEDEDASPSTGDETQTPSAGEASPPPSGAEESDDEGSKPPAPGTVVTSSTLGGATAEGTTGDPQTGTDATGATQTPGDATAATVGPPAGASDSSGDVVVVPSTKKFHSAGCRFASAKGAESMDRAEAESKGYQPCGVCKP